MNFLVDIDRQLRFIFMNLANDERLSDVVVFPDTISENKINPLRVGDNGEH